MAPLVVLRGGEWSGNVFGVTWFVDWGRGWKNPGLSVQPGDLIVDLG